MARVNSRYDLGADAVIAVDLDYQEFGSAAQSMSMLVAPKP